MAVQFTNIHGAEQAAKRHQEIKRLQEAQKSKPEVTLKRDKGDGSSSIPKEKQGEDLNGKYALCMYSLTHPASSYSSGQASVLTFVYCIFG